MNKFIKNTILVILFLVILNACSSKKESKSTIDITTKFSGNRSSYWYDSPSERKRKTDKEVESWKNGDYEKRTGHKPPLYED